MLLTLNLILCTLGILLIAWTAVRLLAHPRRFSADDNDSDGGVPYTDNLPVIDMPPGSRLDDWLTDRDPSAPRKRVRGPLLKA